MKLRSVLVTCSMALLPIGPLAAQDLVDQGVRMQSGTDLAAIGFFVPVACYLVALYMLPKLLKPFI